MGQKNRTIIVVLIALVIVAAVFASFGLYLMPGQTPQVVLPTSSGADAPGNSSNHSAHRKTPHIINFRVILFPSAGRFPATGSYYIRNRPPCKIGIHSF